MLILRVKFFRGAVSVEVLLFFIRWVYKCIRVFFPVLCAQMVMHWVITWTSFKNNYRKACSSKGISDGSPTSSRTYYTHVNFFFVAHFSRGTYDNLNDLPIVEVPHNQLLSTPS